MKFNRKQLLEVIDIVKPAVAKREIVQQQTHLIFTGTNLCATNGSIMISHPLPSEFVSSIKSDDLIKILQSSSSDEVEINLDKDKVRIVTPDTKAKLSVMLDERDKVEELIKSLSDEMSDWKFLPEDFSDALWLCAFSASKNQTDLVLTSVFVNGEDVSTTDKVRTSWYKMKEGVDKMLISAVDALELSNLTVSEYCESDNWLHFKTENEATFSCRKVMGDHLPLVSLFSLIDSGSTIFTLPSEFKTAIESTYVMLDNVKTDPTKTVSVLFKKGEIICKAEQERGSLEKIIKTEYEGEEKEFHVNPYFLSQVLEKSTDVSFHSMKRQDREFSVALFTSGNFKHMVQLPLLKGK